MGETATKARPNPPTRPPPPPHPSSVPRAQIIHHNGHLDYVVNGRLIHPVQPDPAAAAADAAVGNGDGTGTGTGAGGGAATMQFEDHGSIQALDEDFVTFWSSFSLLSETADEEVLSFCDLCSGDNADGADLSLSPVT